MARAKQIERHPGSSIPMLSVAAALVALLVAVSTYAYLLLQPKEGICADGQFARVYLNPLLHPCSENVMIRSQVDNHYAMIQFAQRDQELFQELEALLLRLRHGSLGTAEYEQALDDFHVFVDVTSDVAVE